MATAPFTAAQVRAWAATAGVEVPAKGRLAASVVVAFLVANPKIAREVAASRGVQVGARGPISLATAESLV